MMLAVIGRRNRCPVCGSRSLVLTREGLVCRGCGLVLEDTVFALDTPWSGVEEERVAGRGGRYEGMRVSSAVTRLARAAGVRGVELASKLSRELVTLIDMDPEGAKDVASNDCLRKLMRRRRRRPGEVAAILYTVMSMRRHGAPPLPSLLASMYSLPRRKAKRIIHAVRICMEGGDI
ncbi:MAG: TFIIB-type zinc ribbon-containing protein [Crenarchaeota archaeon]|nr:TFIIB-type zinc ribbon-containing protein [Thermoproteota archaeon]